MIDYRHSLKISLTCIAMIVVATASRATDSHDRFVNERNDETNEQILIAQATGGISAGTIPNSEISYPGASTTRPFVAADPYVVHIMGIQKTVNLGQMSRTFDFSADVPFINPSSRAANPGTMQGWDASTGISRTIAGIGISDDGLPGRIEKRHGMTMVRYVAGDDITAGKCRTQLNGYPIPPRTRVRWELTVAFGAQDGENDWVLTSPRESPVSFWQTKSPLGSNPSMFAVVDTDPEDPKNSLVIHFYRRGGKESRITSVGSARGIPRGAIVPIIIDAFLDERATEEGGKGVMRVSVKGVLVGESVGPTLTWGDAEHNWAISMYLFEEARPYRYTRASFWQTARMFVFPRS